MTKDDIMRLAREAGLQPYYDAQEPAIVAFAALVAAAEREECARLCQEIMQEHNPFDRQAGVARRCLDDIRARRLT